MDEWLAGSRLAHFRVAAAGLGAGRIVSLQQDCGGSFSRGKLARNGEPDHSGADYLGLVSRRRGWVDGLITAWVTSALGARVEEKLRCGERRNVRGGNMLARRTMAEG